eukprot:TCALIF_09318-PA protein Name:"Similar to Nphs1 Nephrin (Rattus norvegicus)" AED:0.04 eAED:0.04 QI:0/0.81/0.83/0.91/0.72/0.83/12/176/948
MSGSSSVSFASENGDLFENRLGQLASLVGNADVLKELGVKIRSHSELWKHVASLVGTSVVIPCNISTPFRDDQVRLVLWFKDNSTKPFYSYDNREEGSTPQHWSNDTMLSGRAGFQVLSIDSANLMLRDVKVEDDGFYKCRVDYKQAQTSTSIVKLDAIKHPQSPRILVHASSSLQDATEQSHSKFVEASTGDHSHGHSQYKEKINVYRIGPYQVGDSLKLKCLVLGGHPSPNVTWSRQRHQQRLTLVSQGDQSYANRGLDEDEVIDDSFHVAHSRRHHGENLVKNVLEIDGLSRTDYGATLTCHTWNNAIEDGPATSVTIDMILQPLRVELMPIVTRNNDPNDQSGTRNRQLGGAGSIFSEGESRQIECVVHGAKPNRPSISWWIGDTKLSPRTFTVDHLASSDITTSVLTFRPRAQDDGQELTCKAYNEAPSAETKEHGTLWPQWKREQHATSRRTGFMNGAVGGYSNDWNPNELNNDEKWTGPEPLGLSHSMTMQVRYPPRSRLILGPTLNGSNIKEGDDVYFECLVDARPPPSRIRWMHNGEIIQPDVANGVIMSNQSLVLQSLKRERSGQYSCTAINSQGRNTSLDLALKIKYKPFCKAGLPSIYGAISDHTIEVLCQVEANPLFDLKFEWTFNSSTGNIRMPNSLVKSKPENASSVLAFTPKNFTLEIRNAQTHALVHNQTRAEEPEFRAVGLKPATGYIVSIYSTNARGTSDRLNFHVFTSNELDNPNILETNESALTNSSKFNEPTNFLKAVFIAAIALALVVIMLFAAICFRRVQLGLRKSNSPNPAIPGKKDVVGLASTDGISGSSSHGFTMKDTTPDDRLMGVRITGNPLDPHEDYGSLNPNSKQCSIPSSSTSSIAPKRQAAGLSESHIICNPVPNPDVIIQESNPINFHPIIDKKYQHIEFFDPEEEHGSLDHPPLVRGSNPLFLKLDQHRESNV